MRKQLLFCTVLLMGLFVLQNNLAQADWVQVRTAGFSAGDATDISFAIDGRGTLYVAYRDDIKGLNVMKFNGSNWVQVGTAGFAAGYYINLVLDGNAFTTMAERVL